MDGRGIIDDGAWDVVTSGMTSKAPTRRTEWIEAKAFVPTGRSMHIILALADWC